MILKIESSTRPWGCFREKISLYSSGAVFPTCVGMNRIIRAPPWGQSLPSDVFLPLLVFAKAWSLPLIIDGHRGGKNKASTAGCGGELWRT